MKYVNAIHCDACSDLENTHWSEKDTTLLIPTTEKVLTYGCISLNLDILKVEEEEARQEW
jgi:hypothetical protein